MKKQTSLLLWENVLWWASEWSPFTVFSPVTQNAKHYSIFKKFIYEYKERKKKNKQEIININSQIYAYLKNEKQYMILVHSSNVSSKKSRYKIDWDKH